MMVAQGAVWYCAFFYAQVFIERVIKVAPSTVNLIMIVIVIASAPLYVLFGWLSDRVGRKWVMTLGTLFTTAALFPGFHAITAAANPALDAAQRATPVVVTADPAQCSLQFDPVGKAQFRTACDIAKSVLTGAGVSYRNLASAPGQPVEVRVGPTAIPVADGRGLAGPALAKLKAATAARITGVLHAAGYPERADPKRTDVAAVIGVLLLFTLGATALYGPQAACLVELFPTRVRYTALSVPYHVGTGWVGGFLPATAYAMVVSSGDIYFGLWYPAIGGALAVIVFVLFLPETRGRDLDA
jgi:MFS family permease